MAVARQEIQPQVLTYEDYMAEGEINRRYDIIDGVRIYMTNASTLHQTILFNIAEALKRYERATNRGRMILAACDVLVTRKPLRTRQPDVFFISHERFGDRKLTDPSPLSTAPELVVEVLSPSESRAVRADKIADYCAIGVNECWVVSPEAETIEVLRLSKAGEERVAFYGQGDTMQSITWPDLTLPVADIFIV